MKEPQPALSMSAIEARLLAIHAQGLGDPEGHTTTTALEQAGFVRTLGGVDVYLALRARVQGLRRVDLEAAVEHAIAQIVPAVRGCMYLVARRDVPLALRIADLLSRARHEREATRAGIRPAEISAIAEAVLDLLAASGPLSTDALRRSLPDGLLRSLGDAGRKIGISSALPGALRRLEFDGRVERAPDGPRLDRERYQWRIPRTSPFAGARIPEPSSALAAALAALFFRAAGTATLADFAAWSGLTQRDARLGIERAGLLPVAVEGVPGASFMLETYRAALTSLEAARPAVALIPFEDNLTALRCAGPGYFVDAKHHRIEVPTWGSSRVTTIGSARHLSYRSIVAAGAIAGFWEFDPSAGEIVLHTFERLDARTRTAVAAAAADTARFLREEMGHGRAFSLDTDAALALRAAAIRAMRSGVKARPAPTTTPTSKATTAAKRPTRAKSTPGKRKAKRR